MDASSNNVLSNNSRIDSIPNASSYSRPVLPEDGAVDGRNGTRYRGGEKKKRKEKKRKKQRQNQQRRSISLRQLGIDTKEFPAGSTSYFSRLPRLWDETVTFKTPSGATACSEGGRG